MEHHKDGRVHYYVMSLGGFRCRGYSNSLRYILNKTEGELIPPEPNPLGSSERRTKKHTDSLSVLFDS